MMPLMPLNYISDEFVATAYHTEALMTLTHSFWCDWCLSLLQSVAFAAWESFNLKPLNGMNHSLWCLWILLIIYMMNLLPVIHSLRSLGAYESLTMLPVMPLYHKSDEFVSSDYAIWFHTMRPLMPMNQLFWCCAYDDIRFILQYGISSYIIKNYI